MNRLAQLVIAIAVMAYFVLDSGQSSDLVYVVATLCLVYLLPFFNIAMHLIRQCITRQPEAHD
ncbi:hypothetical protein [Vibrio harveyi]|uniref:hypothetical protein n=1 Tax=Vibrio harveyi TaxID=669 RepID=UPI003CF724C8